MADEKKELKKEDLTTKPLKDETIKEPQKEIPVSIILSDPAIMKIMDQNKITSLKQLTGMSDEELLKLPGIQKTRLQQIRRLLENVEK